MRRSLTLFIAAALMPAGCNPQQTSGPSLEAAQPSQSQSLKGKKVVMVIASRNFRGEELSKPRSILAARGASVTLASNSLAEATGMLGAKAKADVLIRDVSAADYDAVVFIGGSGASEYFKDPTAHALCKAAAAGRKLLCAICIAPGILANAGVLKGKKATVCKGSADMLKRSGATYTGKPVEVDGLIITADGPGSSSAFGEAIAEALAK